MIFLYIMLSTERSDQQSIYSSTTFNYENILLSVRYEFDQSYWSHMHIAKYV